jgi:hypothetical protein
VKAEDIPERVVTVFHTSQTSSKVVNMKNWYSPMQQPRLGVAIKEVFIKILGHVFYVSMYKQLVRFQNCFVVLSRLYQGEQ